MLSKFLTKRKIVLIILILALLFPFFTQPIRAFTSGPNDTYPFQFYNAVFETEEMNLQSFVYETTRATIMSIVTLIVGDPSEYEGQEGCYFEKISCWYECKIEDPESDCPQCQVDCPEPIGMGSSSNGAVFQLAYFIGLIYANPPASGVQYLADVGRKLNLVQPVYAQEGVGWGRFNYALPIWKTFRNVAYVFFVLILIFIGFAIMFRLKINPQTVVTIQSALPRVILALILITFSYAIVGLLVDLMYVVINLTIFLFSNIQFGFPGWLNWLESLMKGLLPKDPTTNDFRLFLTMVFVGAGPLAILLVIMLLVVIIGIGTFFATGGISSPILAISLLIVVILAFLLLIALLRVCWTLLKAYINVLIALIFAPFQLLAGALPGSNAVGSWFKNLIANLAVWPVVFIMCFLAGYIALSGLTFTGGEIGNLIFLPIVGIGILLMTPKVSDMIKSFLAGKPFEYGTAIGEAFGPVTTFGPPVIGKRIYEYGQKEAAPGALRQEARYKLARQIANVLEARGSFKR